VDPATTNVIFGVGSVMVAAGVALFVGRRRGLDQVEDRADGEVRRLVEAQAARLALQDAELQSLRAQVSDLSRQVEALRSELAIERRITARLRTTSEDDGK